MIKAFAALELLRSPAAAVPMRQRFADDPDRFKTYSLSFGNFLLDYSKNLIDAETMRHLLALATAAEVERHRALMFSGEPINVTENRPVLHVALRSAPDDVYRVAYAILRDTEDAVDATQETFARAFERWDQYDPTRPLRAWLHGIAAHEALDRLRHARVRRLALPTLTRVVATRQSTADDSNPEGIVSRKELVDRALWADARRAGGARPPPLP